MFNWIDVIAPIGLSVIAAVLCLVGLAHAKERAARVACILCAVVFLSATPVLYAMRYASRRYDYKTVHGIRVRQGELNACKKVLVDEAVTWTVNFWQKVFADKPTCVIEGVKDDYIICKDEKLVPVKNYDYDKKQWFDDWVNGYSSWDAAVIAWQGDARTRSLIIHELSHPILRACGIMPKSLSESVNVLHHHFFAQHKLGH